MSIFCRKQQEGQPRRNRGCLWTIIVFVLIYMLTSVVMGYMFGNLMSQKSADIVSNLDGIRSQVSTAIDACVEVDRADLN